MIWIFTVAPRLRHKKSKRWRNRPLCIGNIMICSDIWHKYHEWDAHPLVLYVISRAFRQIWNITSGVYAKYQVQIMLLFVYTTTRNSFVIFTCRYFKLSWNTTALSQSIYRNFSCSSIKLVMFCFPNRGPRELYPLSFYELCVMPLNKTKF